LTGEKRRKRVKKSQPSQKANVKDQQNLSETASLMIMRM